MSNKDIRQYLLNWVKSQDWENKGFYSIPIQKFVYFTKAGFKHTINRSYKYPEVELLLIKRIMEILPNSKFIGFEKDKLGRDNVNGVYNYYAVVCHDDNFYEVWFKVKSTRDKSFFYDHGIIRKLI